MLGRKDQSGMLPESVMGCSPTESLKSGQKVMQQSLLVQSVISGRLFVAIRSPQCACFFSEGGVGMHRFPKTPCSMFFIWPFLLSYLTACQIAPLSNRVGSCNKRAFPGITMLTRSEAFSHVVYIGSNTSLYAFNPGNRTVQWCVNFLSTASGAGIGSLTLSARTLYANAMDGTINAPNYIWSLALEL